MQKNKTIKCWAFRFISSDISVAHQRIWVWLASELIITFSWKKGLEKWKYKMLGFSFFFLQIFWFFHRRKSGWFLIKYSFSLKERILIISRKMANMSVRFSTLSSDVLDYLLKKNWLVSYWFWLLLKRKK